MRSRELAAYRRTLVVATDFAPLYGRSLPTVKQWPAKFGLEPEMYVSDTAVYRLSRALKDIGEQLQPLPDRLAKDAPPSIEPNPAVLQQLVERGTIEVRAVLGGLKEVAEVLDEDRVLVHNWHRRGQLPAPIAMLRSPVKPDGSPARQLAVWDVRQFAEFPGYSERRVQLLAETNTFR